MQPRESLRKAAQPLLVTGLYSGAFAVALLTVDNKIPSIDTFTVYTSCPMDSEPKATYTNHEAKLTCINEQGRRSPAWHTQLTGPTPNLPKQLAQYAMEIPVVRSGLFTLGADPEVSIAGQTVKFENTERLLDPTVYDATSLANR